MAQFETLTVEKNNGIAHLTLNRPDAANGINLTMAKELLTAAIDFDTDPNVRAVVITAKGKMFCAGGDLKSFASSKNNISLLLKELITHLHAAITRLARMDAPVIMAINGTAAGAGFSLAVAGDIVLAAASAKFTMAYTAAGLSPDGSSSYFLPRLIGMRKTQELMLTNRLLSAEEALQWGVINQVIPDQQLDAEALKLATQLANGPTKAFGMVKKLLQSSFDNNLETQLDLEAQGIASMTELHDGKEGIIAFMEKRPPKFTGN